MSEDTGTTTEEKHVTLSRYALYAYDAAKDVSRKVLEEETDHESSFDSEKSFSLSILATNLDAEKETNLRTFLSKRLGRGMFVEGPGNGNVLNMDFCLDDKSTAQAVCYSSLLKKNGIEATSIGDGEFECVQESSPQLYIVCLLTVANGILDFFRPELTGYHELLLPLLDPGLKENLDAVKEYLNDWFDKSLSYICHCISRLGKDVEKVLQLALSGGNFNISSKDEKLKSDFIKFFESCNLSDLLDCKVSERTDNFSVNLKIEKDNYEIIGMKDCSEYCQNWANSLVENNCGDPLILKRIIEDFKLKTIQDMNSLKRMIRQAENDHYALFRTYSFLAHSGYGASLLQHAKHEESVNNNSNALDVISIVEEFMKEQQVI